ncbi:MAG: ORF6N domain-containing protein [Gammaproteobacteria bacterium]|nr:ORF6N domain-containing protein [Gammaproteobacteria bacterium]
MSVKKVVASSDQIATKIMLIRNQKVIVDADLANLYGVTTKRLNEQVKRNRDRFPADFVFELTKSEKLEVVANCDHLARLKFASENPNVFTEHGVIMAASVLNSPKAIEVSVLVVRTFVKLRQLLSTNVTLRHKLSELESRLNGHDDAIKSLVSVIRQMMEMPSTDDKPKIGFVP